MRGITFDERGLCPVVAQDRAGGQVRMVAWANAEAIDRTIETGDAHFFSRSRNALWKKGETSGNVMRVAEIWADCDGDTVIYLVDPAGPSCHTGRRTCFFRRPEGNELRDDARDASPFMTELFDTLLARSTGPADRSYTRSLLDAGFSRIGEKLREEGDELARALDGETDERVVAESADVVYHLLVGLVSRGLAWEDVVRELARRAGRSGLDEKASRPT